ncbi:MAG: SsrA-binding protein SmpB [Deltaproteobacteria bacterium]|nr:SsrA-binding protein SmpB [Deltaproteobacteria bacterium]
MGKTGRKKSSADDGRKVVCRNKRAFHDYHIEDRIEAGLVLVGTEVKSLREGRASLQDAYAAVEDGEAWLVHAHIGEWPHAAWTNHEPERRRKLLLRAREIRRLAIFTQQRGYTLIALSLYFNRANRAKVELGLARGKRKYDKRETIKARDEKRDAERSAKEP